MNLNQPDMILRERQVRERTGLGRTTRWTMVRKGTFPAPVRLTSRAVGWRASDIDAWIKSRAEADNDC